MKLFQCILLLIFSVIVNAKIIINVDVDNSSEVQTTYSGIDVKVVDDEDINWFKMTDSKLYLAVQKLYGRKPNNLYLKSPTPWGDLYKKYHYEQVSRILSVKSIRVKNITKEPVIIMSQDFENFSNKTIKVNTGISQTVENSVTTSWSKSNEFTISQEIEYDVNVIFAKLKGTTGFSFTSTWGKSYEKTESMTVGSTTSMETELAPGQACTAVLSANRGTLEVEIVYSAFLRGHVAVNYKNPLNGHHFHGPRVDAVLKAGGISNEKTIVETLKVGMYMDASLKVYDKETGLPL